MRKLLIITCVLTILLGCNSHIDNAEENTALIEKYVQAVEDLDYKSMDELLDDDYIGLGPSYGDSIGKTAVIENWKYNVETLYKSIDYKKSRTIAVQIPSGENEGEWVSNWAELTIVYKFDSKATIWANTIYKIENGKIVKSFSFYNEADVLEQLGFEFY